MSWIIPFAFCFVWIIVFAPMVGVLLASLSAFAVGMLWKFAWFVKDIIEIWRDPIGAHTRHDIDPYF